MKQLTIAYLIIVISACSSVFATEKTAYCRFVPERSDDFAFENDKIAFRVYGPALKKSKERNGIDCWLKRVSYPIVDKWYKGHVEGKTYHKDTGEGYDPYHVGSSLGCGGLALWKDGKLVQPNVYKSYKIIENGPERVVFELEYVWETENVRELRRITLEKGSRLFRVDSQLTVNDKAAKVQLAIGLTTHEGKAKAESNTAKTWITTWETIDGSGLGTAVMLPDHHNVQYKDIKSKKKDKAHALLITSTKADGKITYYAGYGWEKAGEIKSHEEWKRYISSY